MGGALCGGGTGTVWRAVLVVALALAAAALAVLGTQTEASGETKAGKGRHCVATVGEGMGEAPRTECFSRFRAAIEEATGGRVAEAPNDASKLATDRSLQKAVFAAANGGPSSKAVNGNDVVGCCNVLSVEYEHAGYGGNTLTYRAKGRPCDGDAGLEVGVSYVGDKWNDEISSYVGSGRCQVKHYQHREYRGSSTSLRQQDGRMGVFNDETSSIKWG